MSRHPQPELLARIEETAGPQRTELLEHLSGCRECRSRMLARRPELIFSLLARAPMSEEALDRLSARVTDSVDSDTRQAAVARRIGWASLAASVLLAGVLGVWISGSGAVDPAAGVGTVSVDGPEATAFGGIQILDSRGPAQVLDLSVGETQVVMIFDEELDI